MSAKSETQHIRGEGCICDPFDLAALGHMANCPLNPVSAAIRHNFFIATLPGRSVKSSDD